MYMSFPEVSIIITNYNYNKYLERCVKSCLNQKLVNYEVIVVDDNSNESVKPYLNLYLNDIKLIENKLNVGVAESSNVGIRNARGKYIVRVDADDYINEYMCFFLLTYLKNNKSKLGVSCDYWMVNDYEEKYERKYSKKSPISCGIMYNRNLLLQYGGYNKDYRHREEEELRKRLGDKYLVDNLEIPFYRYRNHNNNKTKSNEYKKMKI